jgi:anti-sigma factor RsiW
MPSPTCSELVELVTEYLEDALSAWDRSRFEGHLAGCEDCTAYVAQVRRTIALIGRVAEVAPDEATCAELVGHFRRRHRAKPGTA